MSRSHKKRPFKQIGGADSEAWEKRTWHRRWRHSNKIKLNCQVELDGYQDIHFKEASNDRTFRKDGRCFLRTSKGTLKKDIQFFKNIDIPCYTYSEEPEYRKREIYHIWGK